MPIPLYLSSPGLSLKTLFPLSLIVLNTDPKRRVKLQVCHPASCHKDLPAPHTDNLFLLKFQGFLISMSAKSHKGSIFWWCPTMYCPHPLLLQPLHLPTLAPSTWSCFSPSPSQTPAFKTCCDQEPEMFLRLAFPQHSLPLKKFWVWYLFREH